MPKIKVLQADIDSAQPKGSGHCMIAAAVKRAVPGAQRVVVDLQSIRYTDPRARKRFTYWTPQVAQRMLVAYDQGGRVKLHNGEVVELEPFAFNLGRLVVEHDAGDSSERKDTRKKVRRRPKGQAPVQKGGRGLPRAALTSDSQAVVTGRRREFGARLIPR